MQITLSIPGGQAVIFQKYYLIRRPIPLDEQEEPTMSASDWIKQCIVGGVYQTLLEGKQMEGYSELLSEIGIDIT